MYDIVFQPGYSLPIFAKTLHIFFTLNVNWIKILREVDAWKENIYKL